MSSDPPEEPADSVEPADPEPGVDAAAEANGEEDRSYEERVLDELVPDIGVGDEDEASATHDPESEIEADLEAETDAEDELSDALEEIDDDLLNAFVGIVVSIKAGILLISIGLLVIGFRDMLTIGGALIAVGCLAFARAAQRYVTHERAETKADGDDNGSDDTAESGRNG